MPSDSPNIAVVVLDTLRYDAFEEHFEWLPGTRFENTWSPSHWTLPAHASLYTGRYPSEVDVHAEQPEFDCETPALAERLQDVGYTTRGYTCNTVVGDAFGFDRGFDHLERLGYQNEKMRHSQDPDLFNWSSFIREHQPHEAPWRYPLGVWKCLTADCNTLESLKYGYNLKFNAGSDRGSDMGAQSILDSLQSLDAASEEFLYLNLMEAHTPYQIPEEYKEVPDDAILFPENPVGSLDTDRDIDVEAIRTRYGNAARYLSDIYHTIFDELRKDYDYIITLSDHGELLGEHGHLGHGFGVYPELTHVPLTVYGGEITTTTNDSLVSLLDVHCTVLELAGLDASDSRGRNLLDDNVAGRAPDTGILTESHGITFPSKNREALQEWASTQAVLDAYLKWRRGIAFPEYYGYDSIENFVENGTAPIDDVRAEIERLIAGFETSTIGGDDGAGPELSEDIESNLEDLGYIG
ncbi:arylsulfatase [Halopenitus malekzadehii]|uniref:Arylsulfatase n=1 Tax=Halopenitus malekzadehii TaxID=1267564 RepID=A0A1H6IJ80_9EURY|nr:sulfatase-like hydrolase/transferase [Halopenitus malekzadehii]SEH46365.1 arylsulfatase [Halopenitus malekzadehii]